MHAGTYKESLVINKPVFIIGVSFGDINAVTIESSVVTTVNFESGSSGALLGHLTVKVFRASIICPISYAKCFCGMIFHLADGQIYVGVLGHGLSLKPFALKARFIFYK